MELNLDEKDLEKIVEAVLENLDISYQVSNEVREAFDYHEDRFRVSWMRMMEAELGDLVQSTKENACSHGQHVYDGLFHAINQYLIYNREDVLKWLFNLPENQNVNQATNQYDVA